LLTLLLAGIRVPFGMLLLHHQASARLPSNLFIYRPFTIHVTHLQLLPAPPRISLFTDCSTSERHFFPPLYFLQKL
jgi:hypothetical protein